MPKDGKDQYQNLKGYDKLTWTDHVRIAVTPDQLQTNPETGAVENPRRKFMEERIRARQEEEKQRQKKK